ncbi:MAG: ABC transporter permease [Trueperaceae bacterium]|nr:ABC transporter permease [Trueperaceae bacterium]
MFLLNVVSANLRKVATEMRRYLPNTISMIVTIYAIFLMFFLGIKFIGDPSNAEANTQYMIVTTVMWFLTLMAMQGIGWEITTEATRGTLEQLYMSPVPAWFILFSRMLATILLNLIVYAVILVLIMATSGQWLRFDWLTLIPLFLISLLGMIGVGFMIAGLALIFKQIQAFLQIAQFIFLAMVAVPVGLSPYLELVPVVRASSMIREAMTSGTSLVAFGASAWLLLVLNALIYFVLGVFVYKRAEARAMNFGLLGQY